MVPDIVESVPNPETVTTLEQLVCWDVNPLVVPGIFFIFTHVVAFFTGDSIILLYLVPPGTTVEIHLVKKIYKSQ